ncbi:hypothetical protein [Lysinibacillus xylanilyticus]|uniref:Lipoprotein n=1 Tax=Lysinibacillus xylanilyticus TaxID=582475 RepID=A0ABT4EQR0_9BACI|nr:hypothetical protein [Lysinibacillus xylanilyticus]MCY9547868.1 hypothetical protein [Lysinibacillus xylanilyticus]
MKKLSLIFAVLVCLVLLTACNDQVPLIEIEAKVSPVSDEEYRKIGATEDLIEPKQEDFKIFEFNFNMEHTDSVKERKIKMYKFENLPQVLNGIDDITRYWNGGGYSQDNESEDFATYHYEFVFYTKGLNDDDIRKAFNNEKITVSWINNKNEQVEKEYNISNLIEFSSNN